MRKTIGAVLCGLTFLAGSAPAQDLMDMMHVKVKPDKMMDFENVIKKMADLQRKYKGDHWLALSTEYGEGNTIHFSTPRDSMAAIESGMEAFMKAVKEGTGPGSARLMQDFNSSVISINTELRRRRWDLSVNAASNQSERMKVVAATRWIRTLTVNVKPGKMDDYIEAWKPFRAELARTTGITPVWVSQSATGPSRFYVAIYYKSMAEMDSADAAVRQALTSEAYKSLMRASSELIYSTNWEILRLRPDLSCLPEEFVSYDPQFWKPVRPVMASKPKANEAARSKPE